MKASDSARGRSPRAALALFAVLCGSPSVSAQEGAAPAAEPAPAVQAPPAAASQEQPTEPAPPEAAPVRQPRPSFALVGGTVHSQVDGAEPFVGTVIVIDGRVDAVGVDLALPLGVERIDCTGLHVVPGLVDGMLSFDPEHDALYIAHGITTVRDMGGDPDVIAELKREARRERVPGPHLVSAGGVIDGAPPISASAIVVESVEDVDRFLPLLQSLGMEFVSLMPSAPTALLDAIHARAAALDMPVWGMVPRGLAVGDAIARGHDGFLGLDAFLPLDTETAEPFDRLDWGRVSPLAFRLWAKSFAESGAALVPVLAEGDRLLTPRSSDAAELVYLNFFYTAQWLAEWQRRRSVIEDPEAGPRFTERTQLANTRRAELVAALSGAGARLVPGSGAPLDWVMPGASLHDELDAWVRAGLAPRDVLRAATAGASDALRLAGRGRIQGGAVADLLVVAGDPRESLAGLRRPERVVVRGRMLARADLDGLLSDLAALQTRVRDENARPLHVEPPERIEGALVLTGQVETRYLAERLSSERYAVVHRPDGSLAITSRLVQPPNGGFMGGEMSITQVLRDGLLETFLIRIERRARPASDDIGAIEAASLRPDVMIVRGLWANGRFNVERALNGQNLGTQTMLERPVTITLDALADTVTCPLVLGQYPGTGDVHALTFGDMMEPVKVEWRIQDHPDGSRWVASRVGALRIEYAPSGALERALYTAAGQTTSMASVPGSVRDFGGAGLPVVFTPPVAPAAPADGGGSDTGTGTVPGTGDGAPGESPRTPATPETAPPSAPRGGAPAPAAGSGSGAAGGSGDGR
jgi:hypothetical protein